MTISEELLRSKNKVICFDIDGTLTNECFIESFLTDSIMDHKNWFARATPNRKIIKALNKLYKSNTIVLFTKRDDCHHDITTNWLKTNKVKYHRLIMQKPYYDFIIDDKAINVKDVL